MIEGSWVVEVSRLCECLGHGQPCSQVTESLMGTKNYKLSLKDVHNRPFPVLEPDGTMEAPCAPLIIAGNPSTTGCCRDLLRMIRHLGKLQFPHRPPCLTLPRIPTATTITIPVNTLRPSPTVLDKDVTNKHQGSAALWPFVPP